MNTTKTLLMTAALATAASLSFAQAPAAPKAAHAALTSALTSATAKAPTHAAAKRLHAKKHHPAPMKHSSQAAKTTGPATP